MLDFSTFTWIHTALSLVAVVAGIPVLLGLIGNRLSGGWTLVFIVTAAATSLTGFGFTGVPFGASHWVGVICLVLLLVTILARYVFNLAGAWRAVYAVSLVTVVYFQLFVLIAQLFKKVPALAARAPTLSEPPFAIAQVVLLVIFIALAVVAARSFRRAAA